MLRMSRFKAVLIILTVLCYSSPIHSERLIVSSKDYYFGNAEVIVGKNSMNDTTLVYALCRSTSGNRTITCILNFESDVFNDSKPKISCNFNIETEIMNGRLEILEINLWGEDKAIFLWRDINGDNLQHTMVTINIVNLRNCELKVHKMKVDNRADNKPQIFITSYDNTYDVAFMDKDRCDILFCKVTVNISGAASEAVRWFPNSGLILGLEPTDDHSKKVLINYGESIPNWREMKIYLLSNTRWNGLLTFHRRVELIWSTSNGFISICNIRICYMFNQDGTAKRRKIFSLLHYPTMFAILYNTPNDKHLSLVCTTDVDGNYRILGLSRGGERLYAFSIEELQCANKPKVLTGKFFIKSDAEYCLSLFFSVNSNVGQYKFNKYCFSGLDVSPEIDN